MGAGGGAIVHIVCSCILNIHAKFHTSVTKCKVHLISCAKQVDYWYSHLAKKLGSMSFFSSICVITAQYFCLPGWKSNSFALSTISSIFNSDHRDNMIHVIFWPDNCILSIPYSFSTFHLWFKISISSVWLVSMRNYSIVALYSNLFKASLTRSCQNLI